MAVFLLIGKTSALTMNIAGVVKDWLLIGLSGGWVGGWVAGWLGGRGAWPWQHLCLLIGGQWQHGLVLPRQLALSSVGDVCARRRSRVESMLLTCPLPALLPRCHCSVDVQERGDGAQPVWLRHRLPGGVLVQLPQAAGHEGGGQPGARPERRAAGGADAAQAPG